MTDAELVEAAGFSPGVAAVIARAQDAENLVALIDTNGDGQTIEVQTFWADRAGRWRCGSSAGAGSRGGGDLRDGREYRYEALPDGSWQVQIVSMR